MQISSRQYDDYGNSGTGEKSQFHPNMQSFGSVIKYVMVIVLQNFLLPRK